MPPRPSHFRSLFGGISLALCLAGTNACGGAGSDNGDGGGQFVAYNPDFSDFQSWRSFSFDSPTASGATHIAGPRTVYINHAPPPGSTKFPLGTIIVKVTSDGQIFARAKRGAGFNAMYGVPDWEWFELNKGTNTINWRGYGPKKGEAYGGDPKAGCNMCHGMAPTTDYVLSPPLQDMLSFDGPAPTVDGDVNFDAGDVESSTDAGVNADADAGVGADTETDPNDASPE